MSVRYRAAFVVLYLLIGVLYILLGLWGGSSIWPILGVWFGILGLLLIRNPAFVIVPGEFRKKSPFGLTIRRYRLTSLADVRMDASAAYVTKPNGKRRRVARRILHHPGDWERLRQHLLQAQASVF